MNWPSIFLVSVLIIVCLVGVVVLRDILTYIDLQRRLKRERRAEN